MNWIEFEILNVNTNIFVMVNEILSKSTSIYNFDDFINY